jgi:hypothetical protein
MPTKTWVVGEEVLAADFNAYLQQQVVSTFPNVAGRDAWATAPDGAICVTTDTNTVWLRGVSDWKALIPWTQYLESGQIGAVAGPITDVLTISNPPGTYQYHLTVSASLAFGGQGAGTASIDILRVLDGTSVNALSLVDVTAGNYTVVPLLGWWNVAAGQDGSFKVRINPTTNVWAMARVLYTITPF